VTTLVRNGLELCYDVRGGSGRALLLPHLQFSWPDFLDLSPGQCSGMTAENARRSE